MRWHHVAGLLFALTTLAWIFSGLMSMNPAPVRHGHRAAAHGPVAAGPAAPDRDDATPQSLIAAAGGPVRELRWLRTAGRTEVLAQPAAGTPLVLDSASAAPAAHSREALLDRAAVLIDAPVLRSEWLTAHDLYWYERAEHTMMGGHDKPLPVLRVVFGDAAASWVHIDPHTGQVLGRLDGTSASSAGCSPCCTAGTGCRCCSAGRCGCAAAGLQPGRPADERHGVLIGLRRLRKKRSHGVRMPASAKAGAYG
jgi:hypothetical protein